MLRRPPSPELPSPAAPPRGCRGFSLSEMMVALAITSVLFLAALSMLALDQKIYNRNDSALEASREARHTMATLEQDLLMTGYQVDTRTVADPGPDGTENTDDDIEGQAAIVYAAPWELVVNADIDPEIDAIRDGLANDSVPSGYAPVTFYTGAETIRYTLDSNGDGAVTADDDRGDDPEEAVSRNDGLFVLWKEVYGYDGTGNVVRRDPIALVRGPVDYPSGIHPVPLFLYWGQFDSDPALDLWGDNGAGGGTAGNGVLEAGEIAALTPVTDEDADDDGTLDPGEDRNGDGILQRRVTELIEKIEIHVTAESPFPDPDWIDPVRSASDEPFRFHSVTMTSAIKPRNIELPGGACGDDPEPTTHPALANACTDPMADGKVTLTWGLSPDDGDFEQDIERYIIFRTDVNNTFGPTPYDEVAAGTGSWEDDFIEMRTWPPKQYWYRVRAMDCTPSLSVGDPVAGPYPPNVGAAYPFSISVADVPGDSGTAIKVTWTASIDDPSNTSGYGGDVKEYWVYRSENSDYRCVPPIAKAAVAASGAAEYGFVDNAANSTSAPSFGTLYYYWIRTKDDNGALSPYSPRYCGRPYKGPAFPVDRHARYVDWGNGYKGVELWFAENPDNAAAGYDQEKILYPVYRAHDTTGDGTPDSLVDDSAGYTTDDNIGAAQWAGLVWTVGDGSTSQLWHSTAGGGAFMDLGDIDFGKRFHGISFGSRLHGIVVGESGISWHTEDGGANWSAAATIGVATDLRAVAHVDEDVAVAVGDSGTVIRTTDGGATWASIASGVADDLRDVAVAGQTVLAVGDNGATILSTDGGRSFAPVLVSTDDLAAACAATEPGGSITLWIGGESGHLWKSTDGGVTWTALALPGASDVEGLACAPGGKAVALVPDDGDVWTTHDASTWAIDPGYGGPAPRQARMLPNGKLFVADQTGELWVRDTDGSSWDNFTIDFSYQPLALAVRPEIVFLDDMVSGFDSGTTLYYVVTAKYDEGDATLDGESGLLPDRPASEETPDDDLDQVLVDSCNNFELQATLP